MNVDLHKLLIELEYKFDMELDGYFKLSEIERVALTKSLIKYFLPYLLTHKNSKETLLIALETMVLESEYYEEYEKAEIFSRFSKEISSLTF